MERLISFVAGVAVIVGSNLLSNVVTDGVILDTAWVKLTNLGALTLAGMGAIIYAIPPIVFSSLGRWVLKILSRRPPDQPLRGPEADIPPWDGKK
jgi:hypothetical protein